MDPERDEMTVGDMRPATKLAYLAVDWDRERWCYTHKIGVSKSTWYKRHQFCDRQQRGRGAGKFKDMVKTRITSGDDLRRFL